MSFKTPTLFYVPPDAAEFRHQVSGPCAPIAIATLFQVPVAKVLPHLVDESGKPLLDTLPNRKYPGTTHGAIIRACGKMSGGMRTQWRQRTLGGEFPQRGIVNITLPIGAPGYREKKYADNHCVALESGFVFESMLWKWVRVEDWQSELRRAYNRDYRLFVRGWITIGA